MAKRNWKRTQPRNWRDAMDLCLEYARERHNRSADHIAELMGEVNKWTLYKWIEAGSLPLRLVKPFEHACGIDFVSRWLAMSGDKLVIDIPRGRHVGPDAVHTLQVALNDTVGALLDFYADKIGVEQTTAMLQTAMEQLAWHKINVEKAHQPELPFDDE
jgi:hypothetical protein